MKLRRPLLVASILAGSLYAGLGTAAAQKGKAVRACGISSLPLSVGNTWTYEPAVFPPPSRGTDGEKKKEQDARDGAAKLYPNQPAKIVITVAAIETKDDVTTVKLTEQVDEHTIETSLTCTATSLKASLDSFFYSGEPGGSWNLTFADQERKGQTLPFVGGKLSGTEWHDDLKATWKRAPSKDTQADLGSGTIKIERRMVIVTEEPAIDATAGNWAKSTKIGIETTGQVTIDHAEGKPYDLPAGLVTWLYFVDNVGLARVENGYFQAFQLQSYTVAK